MEVGLFSLENMLIDGSGTFRELDICRARSESRLWEESWRVVGFFFFFFLSFFLLSSSKENIPEDRYYAWLFNLFACLLGTGLTRMLLAVGFLDEILYLRDSRV